MTLEKLKTMLPKNKEPEKLLSALEAVFDKYEINTRNRIAGFLAQCGHESGEFNVLKENLNYSSDGLLKVFPKYFKTKAEADLYAKKPEKIANKVYANRYGNGDEASGDGYRYSGKGALQLTFKDNYSGFAKSIGKSVEETAQYMLTLDGAIESACWFWKTKGLNEICDADDIKKMTKVINGGDNGLKDRTDHYEYNKEVLDRA